MDFTEMGVFLLVLVCLLHPTHGLVNCTDTEDCSRAARNGDCSRYPVPLHLLDRCPRTCNVCDDTTRECSPGYVERQGRCEICETAVLAEWEIKPSSCPQCPDVTRKGLKCDQLCGERCKKGCDRWSGKCHGCKRSPTTGTGRYGDICTEQCPQHCEGGDCRQSDGTCTEGCKPGYFGSKCDEYCSSNCLCENRTACNTTTCNEDGNCTYGCREGYYGGNCSIPCPPGCSSNSCSTEGTCHSCRRGSYGQQCQFNCSDHCIENECHQTTGLCRHGCEAGFWGDACVSACPDSCVNCSSTTHCFLCKDGWDGSACQHRCQGHCDGGCDDTGKCRQCKNGFFGSRCEAPCSDHCVNRTCSGQFPRNGGTCLKGCKAGYRGVYCQVPCPDHCVTCSQRDVGCYQCQEGWYGSECENRCQDCSGDCHKVTGACMHTASDSSGPPSGGDSRGPVVGLTVPLVLCTVLLLVVALVLLHRRRRSRKKPARSRGSARSSDHLIDIEGSASPRKKVFTRTPGWRSTEEEEEAGEGDLQDYSLPDVVPPKSTLVPLGALAGHVQDMRRRTGFRIEFETLPSKSLYPCVAGTTSQTIPKNRYKNIVAYDHTRVRLHSDYENCPSEYINANYIDGFDQPKKFIATQGPFEPYLGDFWQMVWQENVGQIVMLANVVENGKEKCEKYWPDEGNQMTQGPVQVQCTREKAGSFSCVRDFRVSTESGSSRQVRQYHFQAWPDKGVPSDLDSILTFWQDVTSSRSPKDGPIVVHCSAGIGRTGTVLALDWLLEQARADGAVDVFSCVHNLRQQRFHMVQTVEQYEFLHLVLLTALRQEYPPAEKRSAPSLSSPLPG